MTTTATPPSAVGHLVPALRAGAAYWFSGFRAMLAWHLASLRLWLVVLAAVQVLSGVGFVLGIGLFFDEIPLASALFVSTGVPVVNLVMVGMVLGPQLVADQKVTHSFDFIHALPVPRTASALAWYVVCLVASLPAVAISLGVAVWRYEGLPLAITPDVVPALLLTGFAGTMLGYAIAHAITNPMVTRLVTQFLVFALFAFTPILFAASQMPPWLATVNSWLPFRHMADLVRASLTDLPHPDLAVSYAVVGAWAVVCAALAVRALGRRR
ncbi:MAG: ABC transporter permease [Actinomycetales bacterium]|nr:ABC transporter permease [Actinomycetales bacterium]